MTEDKLIELYAESAFKGMAYLDKVKPGWVDLIDLDCLEMVRTTTCIIGQVFGNYWAYCGRDGEFWENVPKHDLPRYYGFQVGDDDYQATEYPYKVLGDVWTALINDRRGV